MCTYVYTSLSLSIYIYIYRYVHISMHSMIFQVISDYSSNNIPDQRRRSLSGIRGARSNFPLLIVSLQGDGVPLGLS